MAINRENYQQLLSETKEKGATLVAVSKTKPVSDILSLYELGQRDFGENYVQELVEKQTQLPSDIRWHYIGHLQRNKVKFIAPFVHLIHGVDSFRLLQEISKQADKLDRTIQCLLQIHIAAEETKFGMDEAELKDCLDSVANGRATGQFQHIRILGLMGMASFSEDREQVRSELAGLQSMLKKVEPRLDLHGAAPILSMGMSADYDLALKEGSNMIRIGSSLFGARQYPA
jgi:pyridoxal phosphate enzyme (YggS family)